MADQSRLKAISSASEEREIQLHRRLLLKGLGLGAALPLFAPFIQEYTALAQGIRKGRVLLMYTRNGLVNEPGLLARGADGKTEFRGSYSHINKWFKDPTKEGSLANARTADNIVEFAPMSFFQANIVALRGLENLARNTGSGAPDSHEAAGTIFTGRDKPSGRAQGSSLDRAVADSMGKNPWNISPFRNRVDNYSAFFGADGTPVSNATDPSVYLNPIRNAAALLGGVSQVDNTTELRNANECSSVKDFLIDDIRRLSAQLCESSRYLTVTKSIYLSA